MLESLIVEEIGRWPQTLEELLTPLLLIKHFILLSHYSGWWHNCVSQKVITECPRRPRGPFPTWSLEGRISAKVSHFHWVIQVIRPIKGPFVWTQNVSVVKEVVVRLFLLHTRSRLVGRGVLVAWGCRIICHPLWPQLHDLVLLFYFFLVFLFSLLRVTRALPILNSLLLLYNQDVVTRPPYMMVEQQERIEDW